MLQWILIIAFSCFSALGAEDGLIKTVGGDFAKTSINVPLNARETRQIQLYYRLVPPRSDKEKKSPTIVFLYGGPTDVLKDADSIIPTLPESHPLLFVDYRGFGMNQPVDWDDLKVTNASDFNPVAMAKDIQQILEQQLITDYIVVGRSFGTIVATILSSISEVKPRAIVLEGVFHTSIEKKDMQAAIDNLNASLKKHLSEEDIAYLDQGDVLGLPEDVWNGAFQAISAHSPEILSTYITAAREIQARGTHQEKQEFARDLAMLNLKIEEGSLQYQILSRDIYRSAFEVKWRNGEFTIIDEHPVTGANILYYKYQSSEWPLSSPLYYVQGAADTYTVERNARQHFNNQTAVPLRQFLLVPDEGHQPTRQLTPESSRLFWQAITDGRFIPHSVFPTADLVNKTPISCEMLLGSPSALKKKL